MKAMGAVFLGIVGGVIAAATPVHANPMLDFNISAHSPNVGSIKYTTVGGALTGIGVKPDNVTGLNTPLNNGATGVCVGCTLNFTTGALTSTTGSQWFFGGGGSIVLKGGIDFDGGGLGGPNDVAAGTTLLNGTFTIADVEALGPTFKVSIAVFSDVKDPTLLAFYGLPSNIPYDGNFNISFMATGSPPGTFASTQVLSGDVVNSPTPEPGSMILLGSGLAGFAYLARRRKHQ